MREGPTGAEQGLGPAAPLAAFVIEPVDRLDHPGAREVFRDRAEEPRPERVEVHYVIPAPDAGHRREAAVDECLQTLALRRGKIAQGHAAIAAGPTTLGRDIAELCGDGGGIGGIRGPAEDGDLVALGHQPGPEFLDMLLDAAESGRQAAQADHRDLHEALASAAIASR